MPLNYLKTKVCVEEISYTVCPRISYPFCILNYYIKWVTTSWSYCMLSHVHLDLWVYLGWELLVVVHEVNPVEGVDVRQFVEAGGMLLFHVDVSWSEFIAFMYPHLPTIREFILKYNAQAIFTSLPSPKKGQSTV